jgi:heme/copper-type cytochrome/quinol oxidase subunit 4
MEASASRPPVTGKLLAIALVGAAVSVALGVYGHEHDPTGQSILGDGLFFSGTLNMKAWLATAVVVLACIQILLALRMYGKIGSSEAPSWVAGAHRLSGTLAFLISLPVVYHCLWALGFQDTTSRVLIHSLAGCFFYGVFTIKMLGLRLDALPGPTLPILGGAVFASLVAIWLTSALWFFQNIGFPEF